MDIETNFDVDINNISSKDMEKIKQCEWILNSKFIITRDKTESWVQSWYWFFRLNLCLPSFAKLYFYKKLKQFGYDLYGRNEAIRATRFAMNFLLIDIRHEKNKLIKENSTPMPTLEDIRFEELTRKYPENTALWHEQREKRIAGYVPSVKILQTQEPIEVIEHMDKTMVKYDKLHGLYSIVIYSGTAANIFFSTIAAEAENQGEEFFNNLIQKEINKTNNSPFSNNISTKKSKVKEPDISHVQQAMGIGNVDNSLNTEDIF